MIQAVTLFEYYEYQVQSRMLDYQIIQAVTLFEYYEY